jgi:hypothetical protein
MEPKALPLRQKFTVAVRNVRERAVRFILEPQGAEFAMPAGAVFELRAEGPEGDQLEIDFGADQITAWGWSGSIVEVWHEGVSLSGRSMPVPPVPKGMSVRGFLGMVLGDPSLQDPD